MASPLSKPTRSLGTPRVRVAARPLRLMAVHILADLPAGRVFRSVAVCSRVVCAVVVSVGWKVHGLSPSVVYKIQRDGSPRRGGGAVCADQLYVAERDGSYRLGQTRTNRDLAVVYTGISAGPSTRTGDRTYRKLPGNERGTRGGRRPGALGTDPEWAELPSPGPGRGVLTPDARPGPRR